MKKQLLITVFLASTALPATASDFYVSADLGQSELDIDAEDGGYSGTDTAFSLGAGYKLSETFALELAYRDLGDVNQSISETFGNGDFLRFSYDTSVTAFQASVVAQLPLSNTFALYGRLGAGYLKAKTDYEFETVVSNLTHFNAGSSSASDSKTKAVFGVGFKYMLSQSFALRAEYNQYDEWDEAKISSATVGLTYQF
ncbi:MAG: hypothetical protein K0Q78_2612 [Cellvibrio sp.]|nr:hypothetical protein [Cellvibrio sp.]